jgi:hypothetical protein
MGWAGLGWADGFIIVTCGVLNTVFKYSGVSGSQRYHSPCFLFGMQGASQLGLDKGYYIEFRRISSAVPVASARVAPGLAQSFGCSTTELHDFEPEHVCISVGSEKGVLHTKCDAARYPVDKLGIEATHWDEPCRLNLPTASGGALVFTVFTAGVGVENETPNADTRQVPRLAAQGFVYMDDVFHDIYHNDGSIHLEMYHSALAREQSPLITVRYRVSTNIPEPVAQTLVEGGFFDVGNLRESLKQMALLPGNSEEPVAGAESNDMTRFYEKFQTQIGEHFAPWVNAVQQTREQLMQVQMTGEQVTLKDSDQLDMVTMGMMGCVCESITGDSCRMTNQNEIHDGRPATCSRVLTQGIKHFTPMLKNCICQLATPQNAPDMGIGVAHDMAQSVIRSGLRLDDVNRAMNTLVHVIINGKVNNPGTDEDTESRHRVFCGKLLSVAGVDTHTPSGIDWRDPETYALCNNAVENAHAVGCHLSHCLLSSAAKDPHKSRYFYDQAPVAEVQEVQTRVQNMQLPVDTPTPCAAGGVCQVVEQKLVSKKVCVMTEAMIPTGCVMNRIIEHAPGVDSTDPVKFSDINDDCESLTAFAHSKMSHVKVFAERMGFLDPSIFYSKGGKSKRPYKEAEARVQKTIQACVDNKKFWGGEALQLDTVQRQSLAKTLFVVSHYINDETFRMELALVASGCGDTDGSKVNAHLMGKSPKFRLSHDKLHDLSLISGGIGGHCVGWCTGSLPPIDSLKWLRKQSVSRAVDKSPHTGYTRSQLLETTNSVLSVKPVVCSVKSRRGEGGFGDPFGPGKCETTVCGTTATVQRQLLQNFCFVPSCRPQINMEIYQQPQNGIPTEEDVFARFYRQVMFRGSHIVMTSDAGNSLTPGANISNTCLAANNTNQSRVDRQKEVVSPGVSSLVTTNSFADALRLNTQKTRVPTTHTKTIMVNVMNDSDADAVRLNAHVATIRRSLDPPHTRAVVFRKRLADAERIKQLEAEFPAGSYERYTTCCIYYPVNDISLTDLNAKLEKINGKLDGIQSSTPIRFGSRDDSEASWFVAFQIRVDTTTDVRA